MESLKQKKEKQIEPPLAKRAINLEQKRYEDIDFSVTNHLGVPAEFKLKSPENVPPGLEILVLQHLMGLFVNLPPRR